MKKKEHIDMQIVVTRELGKEYTWMKVLTDKLTKEGVMYLAGEAAKETDSAGKKRIRSVLDLVSLLNRKKEWMKEMVGMGAFRDLFQDEFDKKDKEIQNLNEQLQSLSEQIQNQSEQLQSKDEQLQSEKEENTKLRQEIEQLKKQMKEQMSKIAIL